jgi:hypothetical protein
MKFVLSLSQDSHERNDGRSAVEGATVEDEVEWQVAMVTGEYERR